MVKQYPHFIRTTKGTEATYINGRWVSGAPAEETMEPCRFESASGGGYISDGDGKRIDFNWVVYFPLSVSKKTIGEKIVGYDGGQIIANDTVKKFSRGQLNARAWL